jgi:hypothetical protein
VSRLHVAEIGQLVRQCPVAHRRAARAVLGGAARIVAAVAFMVLVAGVVIVVVGMPT